MNLIKCILTANDCYKANQWITPKGVMVHSTGANNPTIKRYVQPLESNPEYNNLINVIGYNKNSNDWNRSGTNACVHGFIGKLADGSIGTAQCLPWNMRGWHAGTGTSGRSANNTHISFEICEDGLSDRDYFDKVYREAVELTAMLCTTYGLDPMADGVVICHSEGYRRGIASGHADVEHWFPRFGKSMDDFRHDVKNEMDGENMTQDQFNAMMDTYLAQRAELPDSEWGAEWEQAKEWGESTGLIKGDSDGDKQYQGWTTRQQMVLFLYRLKNMGL